MFTLNIFSFKHADEISLSFLDPVFISVLNILESPFELICNSITFSLFPYKERVIVCCFAFIHFRDVVYTLILDGQFTVFRDWLALE